MTQNARKRGPRKPDSWGMDEWFMCFPGPWIESYIGLDNYQFRVGVTLLMLIYETDKPLTAPPRYLAGKCGMGVRKFNEVVEELIAAKKLTRTADGALTHPKCDEVLAIRRFYRAGKSHPSSGSADAQPEDSSSSAGADVEQTAENEKQINAGTEPEASRNPDKGNSGVKGSGSSEPPKGGSGAPPAPPPGFGDETPARPGDLWTVCAQLLAPDIPGWSAPEASAEWRAARNAGARLIKTVQRRIRREAGQQQAELILTDALEALTRHRAPAMDILQGIASRLLEDFRKRATQGEAQAGRRFKIITEGGRKFRVDNATGTRVEITASEAA